MQALKILRRRIVLGSALSFIAILSGCGSRTPQSATPPLKILFNTEEEPAEKSAIAQVVQSQLSKAGIPVVLEPVANSVFYDRVGSGNFQCALALWYLDYDDAEGFLTDFYSKAGFRLSKYDNSSYDKAYLSGLLAPTPEKNSKVSGPPTAS